MHKSDRIVLIASILGFIALVFILAMEPSHVVDTTKVNMSIPDITEVVPLEEKHLTVTEHIFKTIQHKEEKVKKNISSLAEKISKKYKSITPEKADTLIKEVKKYSNIHDLDFDLVLGLIGAESSFRKQATSKVGAKGYMQVYPRWHQDKIKDRDINELKTNVEVGTKILADCFKRRKTEKMALACYNGAKRKKDVESYAKLVYKHMDIIQNL